MIQLSENKRNAQISTFFCKAVGRLRDHTFNSVGVCRERSSKSLCIELLSLRGDLGSLSLHLWSLGLLGYLY